MSLEITKEKLQELIDYLQGTCKTIDEGLQTVLEDENADSNLLSEEDHSTIDDHIFLCDNCGWWYEIADKGEEFCTECEEEEY